MFYFKVAEVSECSIDYVREYKMDFNFGSRLGSCQTYDDEIWLCFFQGSGGTQCKMYSNLIFGLTCSWKDREVGKFLIGENFPT